MLKAMIVAAVESTTLATVAYDHRTEILRLEFRNGAVYSYTGVPALIHRALLTAPSKGAYFNHNIRGRFRYQKLETSHHHTDVAGSMR
jgi:hypothetical protein